MDLTQVSYIGPDLDTTSPALGLLPPELAGLLEQVNGFVQFDGGLHVRGICQSPVWHGLAHVMSGPSALHAQYCALLATDVPFAQDCVADQFFLRDGIVWKLWAETGEVKKLDLGLMEFLAAAEADPAGFLEMHPLLRFHMDGGRLQPGQVLHVYPPFCTKESGKGVSLKAVPCEDAITFLAEFAQQLSCLPDGTSIKIRVGP